MPRGNDAQDALRELESRQGINANAEALIEANKNRLPGELRAANSKRIDVPATEALDRSAVEKAVKGLDNTPKDAELVEADDAYAVRGDKVIALVQVDDEGRVEKFAIDLDDVTGSRKAKKASKDAKETRTVESEGEPKGSKKREED